MAGLFDLGTSVARYLPPGVSTGSVDGMAPKRNYQPSNDVRAAAPPTTAGWQPTVTPDQSAPAPGGPDVGLFGGLGDKLNNALTNPLFQFGMGMMGAGSEGKGIGGGLFAGSQNAGNAWKMLQQRRQQQFMQSLSDPNSPTYKAMAGSFSPAAMAAISANPDLLPTLFGHKGDLENAKAIAGINANAAVRAKMMELKFNRDLAAQTMQQFMPGAGSPQPTAGGAHPQPSSAAEVEALPPGTVWQALTDR